MQDSMRGCCKYLQHPLSEERKVKSEENRCPFGTILIIFVRKYLFFSLFILLSSLGCCILQQPLFLSIDAFTKIWLPRMDGMPNLRILKRLS